MIGRSRVEGDPRSLEAGPPPAEDPPRNPVVEHRGRFLEFIPILPSLLTLGNLFCGVLSISYCADALRILASGGKMELALARIGLAGWVIFLAMVFDALDGRVARLTGQESRFGTELDSLADMVSFGVAPAILTKILAEDFFGFEKHRIALGFAAIFVLCAALRLARYNVESDPSEEGTRSFLGLPSPGAAGLVAGIALVYSRFHDYEATRWLIGALPLIVPILGFLMFSRIPYPHLMNRYFRGPQPMKYLVILGSSVAFVVVLGSFEAALAIVLFAYVIIGPAAHLLKLATGRRRTEVLGPPDGGPVD